MAGGSSRPNTRPLSAASSAASRAVWKFAAASRSPTDCGVVGRVASASRSRRTARSRISSRRRYRVVTACCSAASSGSAVSGSAFCRELDNSLLFLLESPQFLRMAFLSKGQLTIVRRFRAFVIRPCGMSRYGSGVGPGLLVALTLPGLVLLLVTVAVAEHVAARLG